MFVVVLVLSLLFLALFAFATIEAFHAVHSLRVGEDTGTIDARGLVTITLVGLGMFATLFLGTVLGVFLTLGAVRGDADRGLLQPLVVRPLGRTELLAGRFGGAVGVCAAYVILLYTVVIVLVHAAGGRWPDRIVGPGLALAAAVTILVALSLLGSTVLSATANGIAMFMVFGAGLVAGLLARSATRSAQRGRDDRPRPGARAALRGALPGRPARPGRRPVGLHRAAGQPRPVRVLARRRTAAVSLVPGLPAARRRAGRLDIQATGPLRAAIVGSVVRSVLCRLSPARDVRPREEAERLAMSSIENPTAAHGLLSAEISNALVAMLHRYTGRGPTRARTTIANNVIVCVMGQTLTKGEQMLAQGGKHEIVLNGRRAYQDTMKTEAVERVQELSGRKVIAFMSTNHIEPDLAVEIFILEPLADDGRPDFESGIDGDGAGVDHARGIATP